MRRTRNDRLGNQPFATKQPELLASQFELTREVGDQARWDPEAVRTRQADMAASAVTAWPKA